MADRTQYFFRQRVTENELNLGFDYAEQAQRNLSADLGWRGIIYGGEASQSSPTPNLTVTIAGPAVAYDRFGERIFIGASQVVDCSVDYTGVPTTVTSSGMVRWVSVYVRFKRVNSDPRTDGNMQQVFFLRQESFEIIVRQGAQAIEAEATRPALVDDELLLCDVMLSYGTLQILNALISSTRTQVLYVASAADVEVDLAGMGMLTSPTVQGALEEIDTVLDSHLDAVVENKHLATQVGFETVNAFYTGQVTVDAALESIPVTLAARTGTPGASYVGAIAVSGTPGNLTAGTVTSQIASLLSQINTHRGLATGAHAASAISFTTNQYLTSTNVQAAVQELMTDLAVGGGVTTSGAADGAHRIGVGDLVDDVPGNSLPALARLTAAPFDADQSAGSAIVQLTSYLDRALTSLRYMALQLLGKVWGAARTPNACFYSVCYGNGLFVAVGQTAIMTSPDGVTWTNRSAISGATLHGVCYSKTAGCFVAVGELSSSSFICRSVDGITWTTIANYSGCLCFYSVCYGNGRFVAVGDGYYGSPSFCVATSTDGTTWFTRTGSLTCQWRGVCWGNNKFVAVGRSPTANNSKVMTSTDGITWTLRDAAGNYLLHSVAWAGDRFVAVSGSSTSYAITSTDGVTWTSVDLAGTTMGFDSVAGAVLPGGSGIPLFVAVGSGEASLTPGTDLVWFSSDGKYWDSAPASHRAAWSGVCFGGPAESPMLVAVDVGASPVGTFTPYMRAMYSGLITPGA